MAPRCLRSYESIAQKNHGPCETCNLPILPGDYYDATVWINGTFFWIEKFHINCPVDPVDPNDGERQYFEKLLPRAA